MANASERLFQLRPVTFRYKNPTSTGDKPLQFGLIAEEVAEVFPELTAYNKAGQPESVAYHVLPALLLNELQKEHAKLEQARKLVQEQGEQLAALKSQMTEVDSLRAEVADLRRLTAQLAARRGADDGIPKPAAQVALAK